MFRRSKVNRRPCSWRRDRRRATPHRRRCPRMALGLQHKHDGCRAVHRVCSTGVVGPGKLNRATHPALLLLAITSSRRLAPNLQELAKRHFDVSSTKTKGSCLAAEVRLVFRLVLRSGHIRGVWYIV
ncbi:hypothetical protein RSAG8_00234, partial [Rhizoctonia solani AG-8 WAC10335]